MNKKHIAIVEHNPQHLAILKQGIEALKICTLVFCADNVYSFLKYCATHKQLPDVVVADVEMPLMDGVALTDYLTMHHPTIKVVATSLYWHAELLQDLVACGAKSLVYKSFVLPPPLLAAAQLNAPIFENLHNALHLIGMKEGYIDPYLIIKQQNNAPLHHMHLTGGRALERQLYNVMGITIGEAQVALLYAATDYTKQEIIGLLNISANKMDQIVTNLYDKLKVTSRDSLVRKCVRTNMVCMARGMLVEAVV